MTSAIHRGAITPSASGVPVTTSCFDREDGVFKVLVNHEEQYSLWPELIRIPCGWTDTGVQGDQNACLEWVEKTWTDMRPLSLRRWMARRDSEQATQASQ